MRGARFGLLGLLLMPAVAFGQSSGNFSARIATMQCGSTTRPERSRAD